MRISRPRASSVTWLMCAWLGGLPMAEADVARTTHNLSAAGPGPVKSSRGTEVCVFCHTPHNANPSRALWNQRLPGTTYRLYSSSTLKATLNQPTGSSRLCLSCHDGTVALGLLRVPPAAGAPGLSSLTGRGSLGTDLSDDHPVSFVYDARLALARGELLPPASLPKSLPLDQTQQLQCTTCHDPHDNTLGQFLRMSNRTSAMCTVCHTIGPWASSSHAKSTSAERGCAACHQPHGAAHPTRLLAEAQESRVCLVCHNGRAASRNVEPEFLKLSAHPVYASNWVHDPREDPRTMPRHVTCADCHNPHQASATGSSAPSVSGPLRGASGVNLSGAPVREARYEYEVCLKCHGLRDPATPGIIRQDNTRNVRLEIDPGNASYHPIAAVGRDPALSGLQPGHTASSLIRCSECHDNDEASFGGRRTRGPHGSRFKPILAREYQQGDPVLESPQSAALCYTCHTRSAVVSGVRFQHEVHLRELGGASCAVCHDAHGSRRHKRLINFMLRDQAGRIVVSPNRMGLLEFLPTGDGNGECSLSCHGKDHHHRTYR